MHIHFLDPYQVGRSYLHRTDARVKLLLGVGFIITTALVPHNGWAIYFLLFAIILSLEFISGIPVTYFLKRSVIALPFILAALPLMFTLPGTSIFSIQIGSLVLSGSVQGLARLISIALKSWISIQMAILLTTTTQFPDILTAMRALRVPRLLVAIFGLMWRYLFVFADEATRLLRARTARSGVSNNTDYRPGGTIRWRAEGAGGLAGNLFFRSIERSERIYQAMLARGYDGEVRSLPQEKMDISNWYILGFGGIVLLFVVALSIVIGL